MTGHYESENWNVKTNDVGFFELKGFVEGILSRLGVARMQVRSYASGLISEGLCCAANGIDILTMGSLAKSLQKQFDIRGAVYYAEINWTALVALIPLMEAKYKELPKFPEVRRDLALQMNKEITFGQIEEVAFQTERKLLKNVGLFDVYEGDKIGADKKSYAVSFVLQDENKTLTDKDIEKAMERIVRALAEKLNAQVR
jgi:phenylalanyl-tRNA synthetase beta chain